MYSVVLVMALAGSAEAPDCHGGHNMGGCCGVAVSHGCNGGGGCFGGGCFGGGHGLFRGCRGGCAGGYGGCAGGYNGCAGGYGGCAGGCAGGYGGVVVPATPAKDMPKAETVPGPKKGVMLPTPATIIVSLPEGAKLTVDGYLTQQSSAQRRLVTPAIQVGQEFTYTLVAETTQNGQAVSQTQNVTVRAGQQSAVNFTFDTVPVSASR